MDDPLTHPTSLNAARPGARVVVRTPQGSCYDGLVGVIRELVNERRTAFVLFDGWQWPIPFALGELMPVSVATRRGNDNGRS